VCVESIGTESADPYTWLPLSPQKDIGWYLSWHDIATPPPVQQAMGAIRDFVRSSGWTKDWTRD
jgi:hypothetical protein